jgi:glycosyltransferase involved in cell wall biosynthesis
VSSPDVVVGVPLHESGEHLSDALGSLLAQTHRDVAFLVVDDASSNDALDRARDLAGGDPRVSLQRNSRRLGLAANWRQLVERAVEEHPAARWFAWGSDHDLWHPRFLEALVAELAASPDAVLAYPLVARFGDAVPAPPVPWRFETRGVEDARTRLALASRRMVAGDMVYGLFDLRALAAAGGFPVALMPDRLLLAELALAGEFLQVEEVLWSRRMTSAPSIARQRRSLFGPGGPPASARLPWWLPHTVALARRRGTRAAVTYGMPSAWMAASGLVRRTLGRAAGALLARGRS